MAAAATAPAKTVAKKRPEPREYTFRLTQRFPEFFQNSSPYSARLDIPSAGIILWPYVDGTPVSFDDNLVYDTKEESWKLNDKEVNVFHQPRSIRYIAGANTIFVDEQEKNSDAYKRDNNGRNPLLDNDANKMDLTFQNAEIRVPSYKKVLLQYLWCYNQCKNQYYKANNRGEKFKPTNPTYEIVINADKDDQVIKIGVLRDQAMQLAKSARKEDMLPHAKWLGISFTHDGSDEPRDAEAIKESYIEKAFMQPKIFLDSFNNPQIKIMYQIRSLVEGENAEITFLKTKGQAHWIQSGNLITELPPDQNPVEYLAQFALTKAGEEFANNLRSFK